MSIRFVMLYSILWVLIFLWLLHSNSDGRSGANIEENNSLMPLQHDKSYSSIYKSNMSTTWITMALCWSGNVELKGKKGFPYKEAVPFSSQLWMKMTPAKVIVQIVYSESEVTSELEHYKNKLEQLGVKVFLVPTPAGLTCVVTSLLIRLLAYLFPFIQDQDIIVTADVDAFVMTPDIYKPLLLPGRDIWLYRYGMTLDSGCTFMMPFIGIRVKIWKDILAYDAKWDLPMQGLLGRGLPKMVDEYKEYINYQGDESGWWIDQAILSHAILKSGICSLPIDNALWQTVNLNPR